VSEELVKWADLILTMERRHARELSLLGRASLPIATFDGFAETGRHADPEALVGDGLDDEIADPIGRPASVHRATFDRLEAGAALIARTLRNT
jgi:protein-tyrosine-phosphatase